MGIESSSIQPVVNVPLPTFLPPPERKLGKIGQFILWIRTTEAEGLIHKIFIYVITFFLSMALIFSIIGLPLCAYGFKELILQNKEAEDKIYFQNLCKSTNDHGRIEFIRGRDIWRDPQIGKIHESTIDKMLTDINAKPEDKEFLSKEALLQRIDLKYDNYPARYDLIIQSKL